MTESEIRIQVKFMGELADLAGFREVTIGLSAAPVLADLVDYLGARFGQQLARRLASRPADPFGYHVVAMVDSRFCGNVCESRVPLLDGMTVVFMEPVAGGSGLTPVE